MSMTPNEIDATYKRLTAEGRTAIQAAHEIAKMIDQNATPGRDKVDYDATPVPARLCKCGHHEISHREGGAACTAPNCFCPQLQTTGPVPPTATASELTERLDQDQAAAVEAAPEFLDCDQFAKAAGLTEGQMMRAEREDRERRETRDGLR